VETGIQVQKDWIPDQVRNDRIAKPSLTHHTRYCRYGFLLEFIPMKIGAGMTEDSLFRLSERPSRIKLFLLTGSSYFREQLQCQELKICNALKLFAIIN
jgi:hypothetical protein